MYSQFMIHGQKNIKLCVNWLCVRSWLRISLKCG